MKSSVGWKVLAVFLTLTCLAPASAVAKRGYFTINPSSNMELRLQGSSGFGISLFANSSQVYLMASGHHAAVQYSAHGVVGKGKIKTRFGSLGRVALRFHPRGEARLLKEPAGNCSGGDSLVQPGVFVGRLDFEGEQDYTKVHASRVKGTVTHTKKQVCKSGGEEGSPSTIRWTILSAVAEENRISFNASEVKFKSRFGASEPSFGATIVEFPQPGFSVFRTIQTETKLATAFKVVTSHGHIDEATVTPPAPFSGSATYQRAATSESESWVGSLAGDFPGLGTVSLAGPNFCATGILLKDCHGPNAWAVTFG